MTEPLEELRRRIASLDQDIVRLATERLDLAAAIGRAKLARGLPIRNYETEADVLARYRHQAEALGAEGTFGEALATLLIAEAVRRQEDGRTPEGAAVQGEAAQGAQRILVLGGGGKMGGWLARFFQGQGHQVASLDPAGGEGLPAETSLDAVLDYDVVLVAVPLSRCADVLREVLRREPDGLVVDIASLKSPILDDLTSAAGRGLRVASLHPLFGPGVRTLSGRIMAVCDCGDPESADEAAALFEGTALTITRLPVEQHDDYMQYVLGLSHLVSILFFTVLARSGRDFGDLGRMASTTFLKQVRTAAEVADENAEMYAEIQRLNRHSAELYQLVRDSLADVEGAALARTPSGFVELMEAGRVWFPGRVPADLG